MEKQAGILARWSAATLFALSLVGLLSCGPRYLAVLLTVTGVPPVAAKIEVRASLKGVTRTNTFSANQRTIGFDLQADTSGAILFTVEAKNEAGCIVGQATKGIEIGEASLYNLEIALSPAGPCSTLPPPDPTKAQLTGLVLSRGTLSPAFAPGMIMYEAQVASWINAIVVTPTAAADVAIKVNGSVVASGQPSAPLSPGALTIETSASGKDPTQYTVSVSKDTATPLSFTAMNLAANDHLGVNMAISGDLLAVAAPGVDNSGAVLDSGAVYVFHKNGASWEQEAVLKADMPKTADAFGGRDGSGYGGAIAISGDLLAIGVAYEDSNAAGINGPVTNYNVTDSGAVYVFRRMAGPAWQKEAYIKAPTAGMNDLFGMGVSLEGNRLAVGAPTPSNTTRAGSVYVFRKENGNWMTDSAALTGTPGSGQDSFGFSVSLSGDRLAVGARNDNSAKPGAGAAFLFLRTGASTWVEDKKLVAPNPQDGVEFGADVALSGDLLAVGDYAEKSGATGIGGDMTSTSATQSGAVYLFRKSGSEWPLEAYLKASNNTAGNAFGSTLSLQGDTLAAGGSLRNSNTGSAYLFRRIGGKWFEESVLTPSGLSTGDQLGAGIALSPSGILAVGLPGKSGGNGSVLLYP